MALYFRKGDRWEDYSIEALDECEASLAPLVAHSERLREKIVLVIHRTRKLIQDYDKGEDMRSIVYVLQNYNQEIIALLRYRQLNEDEKECLRTVYDYTKEIADSFYQNRGHSIPLAKALGFQRTMFSSIVEKYC